MRQLRREATADGEHVHCKSTVQSMYRYYQYNTKNHTFDDVGFVHDFHTCALNRVVHIRPRYQELPPICLLSCSSCTWIAEASRRFLIALVGLGRLAKSKLYQVFCRLILIGSTIPYQRLSIATSSCTEPKLRGLCGP